MPSRDHVLMHASPGAGREVLCRLRFPKLFKLRSHREQLATRGAASALERPLRRGKGRFPAPLINVNPHWIRVNESDLHE